jgi:hypothetical protein
VVASVEGLRSFVRQSARRRDGKIISAYISVVRSESMWHTVPVASCRLDGLEYWLGCHLR